MVGDERKGGNTATWRVIDGAGENAAIADSDVDGTVQKGANMPRKRNALGRGLSALMSASAVSRRCETGPSRAATDP